MDKRIKDNEKAKAKEKDMLSTILESMSLSLRKDRLEKNIHQKRVLSVAMPTESKEFNLQVFHDSIHSISQQQSIESISLSLSYLLFICDSNCIIEPEHLIKSNFIQAINSLIAVQMGNSHIMTKLISILSKLTTRNDPELKTIFTKYTNTSDSLINYYYLLEFSLGNKTTYIEMLIFLSNLLDHCEFNQRKFITDYKKPNKQIFKTIYHTANSMTNNANQDLDVIYAQTLFMASFSNIDYSEYNYLNIISDIRNYLFYIIETKNYYINNNRFDILRTALLGIAYQASTTIEASLRYFFDVNSNSNRLNSIISLYTNKKLQRPIIEIIGNLATNEAKYISKLIKLNVIDLLIGSLNENMNDTPLQERLLWALSNIAAERCFVDLLYEKHILQLLIDMFKSNPPYSLVKEIWWMIENLIGSSTSYQCIEFLNVKMIELIIETIRTWKEPQFLMILISCLKELIAKGRIYPQSQDNIFLNIFIDYSGFDLIEKIYYDTKNNNLKNEAYVFLSMYNQQRKHQDIIMNGE